MAAVQTKGANAPQTSVCKGCGRRTIGNHCVYPSNVVFNALNPVKRDPLLTDSVAAKRRERANAIKAKNHGPKGGMNGGTPKCWMGPPIVMKFAGTNNKGEPTYAPMSTIHQTKLGFAG